MRWWKCDKFHKYKNVRNMIYPLNNKFTCIQSSFVKLLIGFFFSILYLYAASSSDIILNIIISKVHERKYDKYKNVSLMKLLTVFNIPCMKCNILTISNIIFFFYRLCQVLVKCDFIVLSTWRIHSAWLLQSTGCP